LACQINVSATDEKQFGKLGRPVAQRIITFLRERVAPLDDPRAIGEALHGSDPGEIWEYRLGDRRLICEIKDKQILITVLSLGNRRELYH
jgi:mRNA interferase RelE/StbE